MSHTEEIAIVGIGCRFPGGATTPQAYWEILQSGKDATCQVPEERWSLRRFYDPDPDTPGKIYTRRGGYLTESIREFDADFFGISPREAAAMDPQQRLLLEVTWEAFENAGIVPDHVRGSGSGVFVGGFTLDNKIHRLNSLNREAISSHTATNATLGMLANRLSYVLDLNGPSMTVDTACSSSLVALHLAVQALRRGECDLALAGGVNIMFRPAYSVAMSKGGFLSADGRCKSFDASADGYGRGEGAGVLVLKPLKAALSNRDTIHSIIVESGVNQDGKTDGITLPNTNSQVALVNEVLSRANVQPSAIQYVEAHGTGTRAGDSAEAESLSQSIANRRSEQTGPLLIGSAKSNIGHLEAAAGVAGVIKTALALKNQQIPPSIHFREAPEAIDLDALRLQVPKKIHSWPKHSGRAMAAVNSFGYGGTNAHVILAAAARAQKVQLDETARPLVIPVSARSNTSLTRQLNQLYQLLESQPETEFVDFAYTLSRHLSHHKYRTAIVAASMDELKQHLRALLEGQDEEHALVPASETRIKPSLSFVYTGMGSQSWGMGVELLNNEPVAKDVLQHCDVIWTRLAGWSLRDLFADVNGQPMRAPWQAQPANFVVQVMLTEIARAYGMVPAAVVGHSTGEVAAAWAAGSLSLENALIVTWHRSRLQQTCVGTGRMLVIELPLDEVLKILPGELDVAAINGPQSVTIAGAEASLMAFSQILEIDTVFCSMLPVDVPYHSRHMDGIRAEFLDALSNLTAREPAVPLYSSVTAAKIGSGEQDANYWWSNIRNTVNFSKAIDSMIVAGQNVFLEVGPHPVLAPAIKDCLSVANKHGDCIASLRRGKPERDHFASSIATLWTYGIELDWSQAHPNGNRVTLPPYPWDRVELWSEPDISRLDRLGSSEHPMIVRQPQAAVPTWEGDFSRSFHPFLQDHCIQGEAVLPAAAYVELALVARDNKSASVAIENMLFNEASATFETPIVRLHKNDEDGCFQIYCRARQTDSRWRKKASGVLLQTPAPPRQDHVDLDSLKSRCLDPVDVAGFYALTGNIGLQYGASFRCIRKGWIGLNQALLKLDLQSLDATAADEYYIHPVILDGALQCALLLQVNPPQRPRSVQLPVGIDQLRFHHKTGISVWCHAALSNGSVELVLFDDEGTVLTEVFGVKTRDVTLNDAEFRNQAELLYSNQWSHTPAAQRIPPKTSKWLVFADEQGIADQLGEHAAKNHMIHIQLRRGNKYVKHCEASYQISQDSLEDFKKLLSDIAVDDLAGILYLWAVDIPPALAGDVGQLTGRNDVVNLLHIIRHVAEIGSSKLPEITVASVASQIVVHGDQGKQAPGQHAIWSAIRSARLELPYLKIKLVDIATRSPFEASKCLLAELQAVTPDAEVAFRADRRYVNRMVRLGPERYPVHISTPAMQYALTSVLKGGHPSRGFVQLERAELKPGEVEVAVHWSALSDASRRNLQRCKPPHMPALDVQCVGRITAIGDRQINIEIGQEVIVLEPQDKLASHIVVPSTAVIKYPCGFSLEDAGAAYDWLAAYYALFEIGALQHGQWVLIHNADTGVGLAAVQLCRWAGAKIIATSGAKNRCAYLRSLDCCLVSESHSLRFCDDVRTATDDIGVDLVLSPLTGELRNASLDLLCNGGVFLDHSLPEIAGSTSISIKRIESGARYAHINFARLLQNNQAAACRAVEGLEKIYQTESVQQIPAEHFQPVTVEDAIDRCIRDQHIGRLVVETADKVAPLIDRIKQPLVYADSTYLVTGGFGGIGIETIRWLIKCGARNIVVLSRSGPSTATALDVVNQIKSDGIRLESHNLDIADKDKLSQALDQIQANLPPLRGVIHGAGILADNVIETMDCEHVDQVMNAKSTGALNLHLALARVKLDFFICYSSIAASMGNVGQYNYAAANGFLQGLILHRHAHGLVGTCINLGPVADVGMAASDTRVSDRLARLGLQALPIKTVFAVLTEAIREDWGSFDAVDIKWGKWGRQLTASQRQYFSDLAPSDQSNGNDSASMLRDKIHHLGSIERKALLVDLVAAVTASVLGITHSRIDASSNLSDLGTDSIMAAEIGQSISAQTGVSLRTLFLARGPSVSDIAEHMEEIIMQGETL